MKRRILFLFPLFLFLLYYGPIAWENFQKEPAIVMERPATEEDQRTNEDIHPLPVTGFEHYIGNPIDAYVERHGEPNRIGPSGSGGEWWIYGSEQQDYVQVEVKNDIIQSLFVLGKNVNTGSLRVGMTRENVYDETALAKIFSFDVDGTPYHLTLYDKEREMFPLIKFENNSFVMLFFHPDTGEIYGLRYLSPETLLHTNYYHVTGEEEEEYIPRIVEKAPEIVEEEKQEQLISFFSIMRRQAGKESLLSTDQMNRLADDISDTVGKNQLTFGEIIVENEKGDFNQEEPYASIKEMEYIIGKEVYDTPTQFGMFMLESKNRKLLLDSEAEEIGLKTMGDDFLLLLR